MTTGIVLAVLAVIWIGGAVYLHKRPWPWFLVWVMENPYMLMVNNRRSLIPRMRLGKGMKVLDLGCGGGRLTIPAAREVGPEGAVMAVDIQETMLNLTRRRVARAGLNNVDFARVRLTEDPLPGQDYDRVVMVTVLGEIPDRQRLVQEIFAVLKPGGIFTIGEVLGDPSYLTTRYVQELADTAGFSMEIVHTNYLSYTANLVKPVEPGRTGEPVGGAAPVSA